MQPGDVLLYRSSGLFGWIIAVKTWHQISHIEIYDGEGLSVASRDGIGVGRYLTRRDGLCYVLRPRVFNRTLADRYFDSVNGTKYGWLELANFMGLHIEHDGIICSQFAAQYLRSGGLDIFPTDTPERIAPSQFLDLIPADLTEISLL